MAGRRAGSRTSPNQEPYGSDPYAKSVLSVHGYFTLLADIVMKLALPKRSKTAETAADVFRFGSSGVSKTELWFAVNAPMSAKYAPADPPPVANFLGLNPY